MSDFRAIARQILIRLLTEPETALPALARAHIPADAVWDISAPIEQLVGPEAVLEGLILPLRRALPHLDRRDLLFIGGDNIRAEGGQWCAAVTHYVGHFTAPLLGIAPSDHLVFLRSGEFYRVEGDQIIQARIIIDLPDLLLQQGRLPFPGSYGAEITFPAPATQDGLLPNAPDRSATSIGVVNRMIESLHVFDPKTNLSEGQIGEGGTWADDMMWYGPAGIGSNVRWEGFVKDHRESFLHAFPDRKGGNHYCRIGDGDYAALSGWPSMTMTHQGDYLGVPASGKDLTLRVMDFYRIRYTGGEGRIAENWVMLDYVDLMQQMGVDIFSGGTA